ncbi:MAG: hypothetical protein N3I86_01885, partial [Verrucomicrobiae bacterium]|nr:hypothetical protein [Verrucomicrobiae bacterium]
MKLLGGWQASKTIKDELRNSRIGFGSKKLSPNLPEFMSSSLVLRLSSFFSLLDAAPNRPWTKCPSIGFGATAPFAVRCVHDAADLDRMNRIFRIFSRTPSGMWRVRDADPFGKQELRNGGMSEAAGPTAGAPHSTAAVSYT